MVTAFEHYMFTATDCTRISIHKPNYIPHFMPWQLIGCPTTLFIQLLQATLQTAHNIQSQLLPHLLVQDQYKLCYEIMQSYLDSFDTYANFKAL